MQVREKKVSSLLDKKASIGPIPMAQVFPCIGFAMGIGIVRVIISINLTACVLMFIWLASTWWLLTGDNAWHFLSKFISLPKLGKFYKRYIFELLEEFEIEIEE